MILLYLDPGVGSAVIQAIIAATLGVVYAIKTYGRRIRAFFSRKRD